MRSDICRSRLSVFRLGSGRWPRSPAPWSGRNARRGNPTATGSRLRNVAPVPAKTPALSARGISWGSSAKSVSAAARKDPFGGDQVSAVDFFLFLLLFSLNWCVLRLCMEAVSPNLPPPTTTTRHPAPLWSSRGIILQSRASIWTGGEGRFSPRCEKERKKNPPVPWGLLVVCLSHRNPPPHTERYRPECTVDDLHAVTLPVYASW